MTGKKDAEKVEGGATDAAIQQICTKFGKFAQLVGGFPACKPMMTGWWWWSSSNKKILHELVPGI